MKLQIDQHFILTINLVVKWITVFHFFQSCSQRMYLTFYIQHITLTQIFSDNVNIYLSII